MSLLLRWINCRVINCRLIKGRPIKENQMASGKVSKEYRWVLIREECDAFITKEEAVKQARRQWTAHPHHRVPYYVAEAKWYIEPEGQVEACETELPHPH